MRYAVIDLGTNTFNLLIGERKDDKIDFLYSTKHPVLLGMAGITSSIISEEAMKRAKICLSEFKWICDQWEVVKIKSFGTSALRGASNKNDFQLMIQSIFGDPAEIISGDREAELIYKGVRVCHNFQKDSLIMDIGGGSTEFIFVEDGNQMNTQSLNIGVTRLYEHLNFPSEFLDREYRIITELLDQHRGPFETLHIDTLIGCSGSFETFAEMMLRKDLKNVTESIKLDLGDLQEVLNWTMKSTSADRESNEWIIPLRKKMLPISAVKVKWILDLVNPKEVWLSPYSLKEGAFSEIY